MASDGDAAFDLLIAIRHADGEALSAVLEERASELDLAAARQVLRNPFLDRAGIERLLVVRRLMRATEIQGLIARHRKTPEAVALRLVARLSWRDQMEIGLDMRVHPSVRRAADRSLAGRISAMTVGEKVVIARRGAPGLLQALLGDPSPTVVSQALSNPRLSEGALTPVAHRETTAPAVLKAIAEHPRWGVRYGIRFTLARNPATPTATALAQLPFLKKVDLRLVAADRRLAGPVIRRARTLLGGPRD